MQEAQQLLTMTLADTDLPLTLAEGAFPDLLGEAEEFKTSVKPLNQVRKEKRSKSKDEDALLLDELLDDDAEEEKKLEYEPGNKKLGQKDDTSRTDETDEITEQLQPPVRVEFSSKLERERIYYGEDLDGEEDNTTISSAASDASEETIDLLGRAHDRLAMQQWQDEIKTLKDTIEKKNHEIEVITGQLRRAVATKCDLVLAHTELERHHEFNLKQQQQNVKNLELMTRELVENRSKIELELLNEIANLTNKTKEAEMRHRDELDDWERLHRNEMLEKDLQIAKLEQEIRRLRDPDAESDDRELRKKRALKVMFNIPLYNHGSSAKSDDSHYTK